MSSHQSHKAIEFLCVAGPKATSGLLMIVANVALLKIFGPAQFGVYSLCITNILMIDILVGSATDMGVLRLSPLYLKDRPARARAIEMSALFIKIIIVAGLLVIGGWWSEAIARYVLHDAQAARLVIITLIGGASLLVLRSVLVHLQVEARFFAYGGVEWCHALVKFGGIALLIIAEMASPGAVLSFFVIGPLSACLIGIWYVWRKFSVGHWYAEKGTGAELIGYVKWYALTIILGSVIGRMDIYFITGMRDMTQVGLFAAAQIVAFIPELLGLYIAVVLIPRIMPLWRSGEFYPFFKSTQRLLIIFAGLIYGVAALGLKVYGAELIPAGYDVAADVALILLLGALAGMYVHPLTVSMLMFLRPRLLLYIDIIAFPIIVVAYYLAIKSWGIIGAAWVTSFTRIGRAVIAEFFARRLARQNVREVMSS